MTDHNRYHPPTPEEFRALLSAWGLTGSRAGEQINVVDRHIRRYTSGAHKVPYPVLYTLAHKNTKIIISCAGWRKELKEYLKKFQI